MTEPVASNVISRIGQEPDSPEKKTRVRKAFFYVWTVIGAVILVGVLIYLLKILALPVSMLIWTLVFVFCLRGIVSAFADRGVNRVVATTLAYVVMFLVLGILGVLMFSPAFGLNDQFANIITSIPDYVDAISKWVQEMYTRYSAWFDNDTVRNILKSATDSLSGWASSAASGAAGAVVDAGTVIANGATAIGFALVIAFWILLELPQIGAETRRIISPKYYDDAQFLHVTFTRIMGGYIKGTLVQCVLIGLACGVLFAIAGIPNAPALGVITGVLNIIPIVGPWLGGAVAAISAVFVSPFTALIALVGTIAIQQFVYTFVSPKIMSSSVDVHPALTLIAMMVGSAIGGAMNGLLGSLVGMLFSIPAIAVIKSCFVYYFEKHTGRQVVSSDGVFFKGVPSEGSEAGKAIDPFHDATSASPDSTKTKHKFFWQKKDADKDTVSKDSNKSKTDTDTTKPS